MVTQVPDNAPAEHSDPPTPGTFVPGVSAATPDPPEPAATASGAPAPNQSPPGTCHVSEPLATADILGTAVPALSAVPRVAGPGPEPANPQSGLLISFEGGDGVGKTTQIRILADLLSAAGVDHVLTREPGGTELGRAIRELLLHGGQVSSRAEALLYAADRAHHVDTLVRPALERGAVVLTDRYLDSSVAYQGAARSLGPEEVRALSLWAVGGLLPDLTILLDAEPCLVARRTVARGTKDRLEREPEAFHAALRAAFLEMAAKEPTRFVVIDADRPVDQVADDVIEAAVGAVRAHGARFGGGAHQRVLVGLEAFVAASTHRRGT